MPARRALPDEPPAASPGGAAPDPATRALHAAASAWRTSMLRFALLHLQPPEEAEDAVQDALLALLNAPPGARAAQADGRAYLFGILKHKITDRLRAKYRRQASAAQADTGGTGEVDDGGAALDAALFDARGHWQAGAAPTAWHCPQAQLQSRQFLAVVDACVEKLPPKPARVFRMKELLDCDAEEICTTLGISRSDYWQCMSRARRQLQACLQQRWFGHG